MPTFHPFRGLRYDPSLVTMGEVIAPPYDVVDEPGRAELAARSPYNAILVELPAEDPARGADRYAVAAQLLAAWQEKGVLRRDGAPCFYGYRMSYVDDTGARLETTGVLGALGLEAHEGGILPHEETMPKPKGDRLYLLRATQTNLSPIWGLSMARGLTALCTPEATRAKEIISAVDAEGVTHSLWCIENPDARAAIAAAVGSTPVVIADGHHRFETALNYRAEQTEVSKPDSEGSGGGSDAVLAFVVELAEEQLHVRSIHRVLSGLPAGFDLVGAFAGSFTAEPYGGDPAGLNATLLVERGAIALVGRGGAWLLREGTAAGSGNNVLNELDSVKLRAVLDTLPGHEIDYEARWPVVLDAVQSGQADAAVMIRPVTVDQIDRAAHAHLRMPPKTTFFHPKPRTGMVCRPL